MSGCGGCCSDKDVHDVEQKEIKLPEGEIISLTDKAAAKIKEFMNSEENKKEGLRIMVVPGGCAGYQYGMDFDDRKESDMVSKQHGVTVLVDRKSAGHLAGTRIDFVDSLSGSGFKIENPNAKQSCGCGNSFM